MNDSTAKRTAFRQMHASGFFVLPNAWDVGSAVRFERLGFKAIASTSAGAAWAVGKEDGELGLNGALEHLRMLVGATALPVNADFENAYADRPEEVAKNVTLALETGIAALSVEDWSGSELYETALAAERIRAARAAIDAVDPSALLVGRNENYQVPGMSAAASIARAVAYAEAGADCLFVPLIRDSGAVAELVAAVAPKPVSVVVHDYDEKIRAFAALGVRRCSVGGSLARRVWTTFDEAARTLKRCEEVANA